MAGKKSKYYEDSSSQNFLTEDTNIVNNTKEVDTVHEDIIDNSISEKEDINRDNIVEEEKELEESKSASIDNLENKVNPQEVKDKNKVNSKELYSVNLCKRKRNRY